MDFRIIRTMEASFSCFGNGANSPGIERWNLVKKLSHGVGRWQWSRSAVEAVALLVTARVGDHTDLVKTFRL